MGAAAGLTAAVSVAIMSAAGGDPHNRCPPFPSPWDEDAFLRMHLDSLALISSDYLFEYRIGGAADRRDIVEGIDSACEAVARLGLEEQLVPSAALERFDRLVIPDLFDFVKRRELRPTRQEVEAYYYEHLKRFGEPDSFVGESFLIENGPDMEADAARWKQKLETSGLPFAAVASEYRRSVGEDDPPLLRPVHRGPTREEVFDIFFQADPDAAFFGPVKTEHGLLFGKLHSRRAAGPAPLAEVEERIESIIVEDRLERFYAGFRHRQGARHEIDTADGDSVPPAPAREFIAYRFDGRPVTYGEVLDRYPGILGVKDSAAFYRSITKTALSGELVFAASEAQALRGSREYVFLRASFISRYLVHRFLESEFEKIAPAEEDLVRFYNEHRGDLYRPEPKVKVIVLTVSRNPYRVSHPISLHRSTREAWDNVRRIRDAFVSAGTPDPFSFGRYADLPGFRAILLEDWTPWGELDPLLRSQIGDHGPGYTSPILITRAAYVFCHILDRREGEPRPFAELRSRVAADYAEERKAKIRRESGLEGYRGPR